MRIVWLEAARDDLRAIRRYISRDNPAAAKRVATRIVAATAGLQKNPNLGRPGRWSETRELVIPGSRYILPYRLRGQTIEILRVLHGAQDWPDLPID